MAIYALWIVFYCADQPPFIRQDPDFSCNALGELIMRTNSPISPPLLWGAYAQARPAPAGHESDMSQRSKPQPKVVKQIDEPPLMQLECRCGYIESAGSAREPLPDDIRAAVERDFARHACIPKGTLDLE